MSMTRLLIDTPAYTQAQIENFLKLKANGKRLSLQRIGSFLGGLAGGARKGTVQVNTGITYSSATLTVASTGPTNTQTFVIAGTTFTCVTSGATGNQFNLNATPATVAANIVAAVNGSATARVTQAVVATAVGAVVTFTARVPGTMGNGLALTSTLSNVTAVDFAGAVNGTLVTLDLS